MVCFLICKKERGGLGEESSSVSSFLLRNFHKFFKSPAACWTCAHRCLLSTQPRQNGRRTHHLSSVTNFQPLHFFTATVCVTLRPPSESVTKSVRPAFLQNVPSLPSIPYSCTMLPLSHLPSTPPLGPSARPAVEKDSSGKHLPCIFLFPHRGP